MHAQDVNTGLVDSKVIRLPDQVARQLETNMIVRWVRLVAVNSIAGYRYMHGLG